MNNYIEYKPIDSDAPSEIHSFQIRSFLKPKICFHCNDFIWGEGFIGYSCLKCSQCVHNKCRLFVNNSKCLENDAETIDEISRKTLFPVENWCVQTVKEWLAVVNIHRYSEIFGNYGINGVKLLSLDVYQLFAFRIRDPFHHAAILQARDELIFKSKLYSNIQQVILEQEEAKKNLIQNQFKADNHHFLLKTLSKLTDCSICRRPLLGIIHQGLQCQKCGLLCHRQCSQIGLPQCKLDPKTFKPRKNVIFGANLIELMSQEASDQAPLFLARLFKNIEERALQNSEDLYDVYRLSADSAKIDKIKEFINENGLELINFDSYDLNTVAALVKSFLRDLQDSVLPECLYDRLVAKIQTMKLDELKQIINEQLNPVNLTCLKSVMAHLIRVWDYQHKVRGCQYLPDKLFHIFRSILIRPEWKNITSIVVNTDNQTLVIQRLIIEVDWGVELPEYKVRPKRPTAPVEQDLIRSVTSETLDSISENQWFWGDINRDETYLILKNCPDGSFLVRNSTDKSFDSPYTLCVMKSSLVKSIKIFRQEQSNGNFYDIEKPCRFDSVANLISYYSRVSLREYNHNLNLVLTYGVSKYKFGKTTQWSIDKLYSSFQDAFNQFEQLTKKYDNLEIEINSVREDMENKKLAMEALEKIIEMYNQQISQVNRTINSNLYKKTSAISATRLLVSQLMPMSLAGRSSDETNDDEAGQLDSLMKKNKEKLESRIREFNIKREKLREEVDYCNTVLSQLQEEVDLLRPDLVEMRKKRENYHMWLIQRGENDDKIQNNLERMSSVNLNESLDLSQETQMCLSEISEDYCEKNVDIHANSLNWFIADCTRERAIEFLKSKPNGTYLVRPNSKPNSKYILSMVCNGEIRHILIEENNSGCFLKSSYIKRRMALNSARDEQDYLNSSALSLNSSFDDTKNSDSGSEEEIKFKTLTELIVFYSKNLIKLGNLVLDDKLSLPAF
ncbi:phosphatidylinositol 3-kinase regulatory subunit alpha [Brachionus plicatilis]|uniref:Phosphatidylinositol 3-kinase regulatory subunit alpha n=1 Tax=Brachionus plicatilis TaxID=10195 RepID=A0A3M7T5U8_BRAPC|nr:phosphatidylinositol 3-kinase regulatory subunit alpha [Brachionus plicatilis]